MADEREQVQMLVQAIQDALRDALVVYDKAKEANAEGRITIKGSGFSIDWAWPAGDCRFRLSVLATVDDPILKEPSNG